MVIGNKLEIFENFEIDRKLPKHSQTEQVQLTGSIRVPTNIIIGSNNSSDAFESWGDVSMVRSNNWVSGESSVLDQLRKKETKWFNKWLDYFKKKKIEKKKTMTILNFFTSLATSLNDITVLHDTAIHYENAIGNAMKAGQVSLVEKLKSRLDSAKSELQLVNAGLTKYLLEDQVVDFYVKTNSDKKLKLTWIKNFIKPIPSDILKVKEILDNQLIFDNYVILHYDPNDDATDLTDFEKKELERRKKDPIIFGLINGSRRLYYVGDWIDEYCNLTLDVVVETLQEKVNEINNNSVKTYLDTGERKDERILINDKVKKTKSSSPKKIKNNH